MAKKTDSKELDELLEKLYDAGYQQAAIDSLPSEEEIIDFRKKDISGARTALQELINKERAEAREEGLEIALKICREITNAKKEFKEE